MKKIHGGDIYSYGDNITDFSSNINPLGLTQGIADAVRESICDIAKYPDVECKKLRKAIAVKENTTYENIICGNGAAEIIFNAVQAIAPKRTVFTAPAFMEYELAADTVNAEKTFYQLKEENQFEIGIDITKLIDENTDMVFICNPNNPTGRCIFADKIKKITEKCKRNNAFIVVDECFMDFADDAEKYSAVNMISDYDNILILKSFTKLYAMPGLRLGYGICGNTELLEKMYCARQPWNVSVVAQAAGIAALNERELPIKTREYIGRERMYIEEGLKRLNIRFFKSEANFILFKSRPGLDKRLLKFNILIRSCSNYRGLDESYYRIAVKTHIENERLLYALEAVIGGG